MKIIDNKKDYYDYLSGIYGIDDKIVYDRRKSVPIREIQYGHSLFFDKTPHNSIYGSDTPRTGYLSPDSEYRKYYSLVNLTMVIEIGYTHYYIKVKRYRVHENDPISFSYELLTEDEYWKPDASDYKFKYRVWVEDRAKRKAAASKKFASTPLAIKFVYSDANNWSARNGDKYIVENPILKDIPGVASCISPETVWQGIYDYISSTKDVKIEDNRTDIQHLEAAGFDKKTSFRNM